MPLDVHASGKVFAVDTLAKLVGPAGGASLEPLLRWKGQSNAYAVTTYADGSPTVKSHDDWLASGAVTETNSASARLGIQARFMNLAKQTSAAQAAAFVPTREELQLLKEQGWASPEPPGADPLKTGPGKPYHDWRNSPDYAEWLKLVRGHLSTDAVPR